MRGRGFEVGLEGDVGRGKVRVRDVRGPSGGRFSDDLLHEPEMNRTGVCITAWRGATPRGGQPPLMLHQLNRNAPLRRNPHCFFFFFFFFTAVALSSRYVFPLYL